jgi:4-hydroxy-2-oxoglutarate aldolase
MQGKYEEAKILHFKLSRLNQAVSGTWGVAGVKASMDIMGFKGGQPRHPLKAVTKEAVGEIKRQIVNEGFIS